MKHAYGKCKDKVAHYAHHIMRVYRGVDVQLHTFLTLELDKDKWSA
jgi:hypothetical protein